jgi:hypothetical protein
MCMGYMCILYTTHYTHYTLHPHHTPTHNSNKYTFTCIFACSCSGLSLCFIPPSQADLGKLDFKCKYYRKRRRKSLPPTLLRISQSKAKLPIQMQLSPLTLVQGKSIGLVACLSLSLYLGFEKGKGAAYLPLYLHLHTACCMLHTTYQQPSESQPSPVRESRMRLSVCLSVYLHRFREQMCCCMLCIMYCVLVDK